MGNSQQWKKKKVLRLYIYLQGYVKGDCEGKGIECIEFEVYVPVLLKPKTVCDIEYLAVAIYDTSTDNVNIKFVPKDLYPPECRFYYIFSQVIHCSRLWPIGGMCELRDLKQVASIEVDLCSCMLFVSLCVRSSFLF